MFQVMDRGSINRYHSEFKIVGVRVMRWKGGRGDDAFWLVGLDVTRDVVTLTQIGLCEWRKGEGWWSGD